MYPDAIKGPAHMAKLIEPNATVAEEFVQGGTMKLSFTDCGAKHGKVIQ